MNFFGHCVLAGWQKADPEFALGSMLPDFAHMLGCTRVSSSSGALASGIAFHHRTDEVFHRSTPFVSLQREGWRALGSAGVPRGARLAAAHVGLELMLDAELATDQANVARYVDALQSMSPEVLARRVSWTGRSEDGCELAYAGLVRTLLERRDHLAPPGPAGVAARLHRILAGRPKLALPDTSLDAVEAWARVAWPQLQRALPGWLSELRAGLGLAPAPDRPQGFAPERTDLPTSNCAPEASSIRRSPPSDPSQPAPSPPNCQP